MDCLGQHFPRQQNMIHHETPGLENPKFEGTERDNSLLWIKLTHCIRSEETCLLRFFLSEVLLSVVQLPSQLMILIYSPKNISSSPGRSGLVHK